MPFTFSHPAIVLPFSKIQSKYISVSCLVVGSVTPDFEYFLTMKLTGRYSHTLAGVFAFDLPVALALIFIFHRIVKKPFINSLPGYFHVRLIALRDFDFLTHFKQYFPGYFFCLLIGILSHIGWDSFTHSNASLVRIFPVLSESLESSFLPSLPLYHYLQHISTLLGAGVIIYFFHTQPFDYAVDNKLNIRYWLRIILLALFAFLIRWAVGFEYLGDVVATIIAAFVMGTLIVSTFYRVQPSPPSS